MRLSTVCTPIIRGGVWERYFDNNGSFMHVNTAWAASNQSQTSIDGITIINGGSNTFVVNATAGLRVGGRLTICLFAKLGGGVLWDPYSILRADAVSGLTDNRPFVPQGSLYQGAGDAYLSSCNVYTITATTNVSFKPYAKFVNDDDQVLFFYVHVTYAPL